MSQIELSGIDIDYQLLGPSGAQAIALTPGGRFSKETTGFRELGESLAASGMRVLLWDRPNCGASGICFDGDSEALLQGRILTQLIRALELGPTAAGGGSAGSRTSLFAALADPETISHLIPWWISGGAVSLLTLGAAYFGTPAVAASLFGLAAVLELPQWDAIKNDPLKRKKFLAQDSKRFVATMERWAVSFVASETSPVPGMTQDDFKRLTMPTLIFRGSTDDIYHPARISDWVHELIPHSTIIEPPWHNEAPMKRLAAAAKTGGSPFQDWPLLAPAILNFTSP